MGFRERERERWVRLSKLKWKDRKVDEEGLKWFLREAKMFGEFKP